MSGNRRSENDAGGGAADATSSHAPNKASANQPQISSQPFVSPGTPAMKPIPKIKDLIGGTPVKTEEPLKTEPAAQPEPAKVEEQPQPVPGQPAVTAENGAVTPDEVTAPETPKESFEACWKQLFEDIFKQKQLIYCTMKDVIPAYENDIITVVVKNGIMEDQYQMHKVAALEYWRNHFSLNVDDIVIVVDESLEGKGKDIILTNEDKLKHMQKQNQELLNFLNAMNFRMKDTN